MIRFEVRASVSPLTGSGVVDAAGLLSRIAVGCRSATEAMAKVGQKSRRSVRLLHVSLLQA